MKLGEVEIIDKGDGLIDQNVVGMYDVSRVAKLITAGPSNNDFNVVSSEKFLAIWAENTMTIFKVGISIEFVKTLSFPNNVVSASLLGNSDYLIFLLEDSIFAMNMERFSLIFEMNITPIFTRLDCRVDGCDIYLTLFANEGYKSIVLPDFANLTDERMCSVLNSSLSDETAITSLRLAEKNNNRLECVHMGQVDSKVFLTSDRKGFYLYSPFIEDFMLIKSHVELKKIVVCGNHLIALTATPSLRFFNAVIMEWVKETSLEKINEGEIVDFSYVDENSLEFPTVFACKMRLSDMTKIVIYNIELEQLLLKMPCSANALVSTCNNDGRVLLLVGTSDNGDAVDLIDVTQSDPGHRLHSLIEKLRFDEAEAFAIKHKLDVQEVHKRRVLHMVSTCDLDDDQDSSFKMLMRTLEKIKDHSLVGDVCLNLLAISRRYDRMLAYLTYTKKRRIVDVNVISEFDKFGYILTTFRMIAGTSVDTKEKKELWEYFIDVVREVTDWTDVYFQMLKGNAISEARIIWKRHGAQTIKEINDDESGEMVSKCIESLKVATLNDIQCWRSAVEHLSVDILGDCLQVADKIVPEMEQFLVFLVDELEQREKDSFPDNSMHVALMMEKSVMRMAAEASTPTQKGTLAIEGNVLWAIDEQGTSPIDRLKKIYLALKSMKRLKEVYKCHMTYEAFCRSNPERICHVMLNNALSNVQTLGEELRDLVKPYMEEHQLSWDQTFYTYVKSISVANHTVDYSSRAERTDWQDKCIELCANMTDEKLRAHAIGCVASASSLPWSQRLSKAVDSVLSSTTLRFTELTIMQRYVYCAEFQALAYKYRLSGTLVDLVIETKDLRVLLSLVNMMLNYNDGQQIDKKTQVSEVMQLVTLYEQIGNIDWRNAVNREFIHSMVMVAMMKKKIPVGELYSIICEHDVKLRELIIEHVLKYVISVASSKHHDKELREYTIDVGLSLMSSSSRNFLTDNTEIYDSLSNLRKLLAVDPSLTYDMMQQEMWIISHMRNISKSDMGIAQKFVECQRVGLDECAVMKYMLQRAETRDGVMGMINFTVDSIVELTMRKAFVTDDLVRKYWIDAIVFILTQLPEMNKRADEETRADEFVIAVTRLKNGVVTLLDYCVNHMDIENLGIENIEFLINVNNYFDLCTQVLRQFVRSRSDDTTAMDTSQSSQIDGTSKQLSGASETNTYSFGIDRRLGMYTLRNESVIIDVHLNGIFALADVARSVGRLPSTSISEASAEEFRSAWESLFNILSVHSQDLLLIHMRTYASTLCCFSGEWQESCANVTSSVATLVENLILQHPYDKWLSGAILGTLPQDRVNQILLALRSCAMIKKSTQSMLNYLELSAHFSQLYKRAETSTIIAHYERRWWTKTLGKVGLQVSISSSMDFVKILQQATEVPKLVSSALLYKFLSTFAETVFGRKKITTLTASELMIRYAVMLVEKAHKVAEQMEDGREKEKRIREITLVAVESLKYAADSSAKIYNYFVNILYTLCPYTYEVIEIVLKIVEQHATTPAQTTFHEHCKSIVNYLQANHRMCYTTKEETAWYQTRSSMINAERKIYSSEMTVLDQPYGYGIRQKYEQLNSGQNDSSTNSNGSEPNNIMSADSSAIWSCDQNEVIVTMPKRAKQFLPFHMFLIRDVDEIKSTLRPVVNSLITAENVIQWQTFIRSVPWLTNHFSRTQLVSSAVFKSAERAAKNKSLMEDEEWMLIQELFHVCKNRNVVISTMAMLFRSLPLSDVKVHLLRLGCQLAKSWLEDDSISPEDRTAIKEQYQRLKEGIEQFVVEIALKKRNLFNETTADKLKAPLPLCVHVYDHCIDWTDEKDIQEKMEMVREIAEETGVDLNELHPKLFKIWLDTDGDTTKDVDEMETEPIDMNDTMGDVSMESTDLQQGNPLNDKLSTPLPILNPHLTKMVHIGRTINQPELKSILNAYLDGKNRPSASGYMRACCAMLRLFDQQALGNFNVTAEHLGGVICLYTKKHLLEMSRIDVRDEQETADTELIKLLLRSPTKNSALTYTLACLMIDEQYTDGKNVEQIMVRLQQEQQWIIMKSLLETARIRGTYKTIRSFSLLWFKTVDKLLKNIEEDTQMSEDEKGVELRKLIFWTLSCPQESGRQSSASSELKNMGCPIASSILSLSSSFTIPAMTICDYSTSNPVRDIDMCWARCQEATDA